MSIAPNEEEQNSVRAEGLVHMCVSIRSLDHARLPTIPKVQSEDYQPLKKVHFVMINLGVFKRDEEAM